MAMNPVVCPTCGGGGQVAPGCAACNGAGQVANGCPACGGTGANPDYVGSPLVDPSPLAQAAGVGPEYCQTCNGTGSLTCATCGGAGHVVQQCPTCHGVGHLPGGGGDAAAAA